MESGQESQWSHAGVTVESRWSQGRNHGGVRTGVTVESGQESQWSHAGVTVESRWSQGRSHGGVMCVGGAPHAIRNVFWSRNSKMESLKLGRGEIYWLVGRMVYFG